MKPSSEKAKIELINEPRSKKAEDKKANGKSDKKIEAQPFPIPPAPRCPVDN